MRNALRVCLYTQNGRLPVETNDKCSDGTEPRVKRIEAPGGLDLHPLPKQPVRLNRRASIGVSAIILLLLLAFAHGGYKRQIPEQSDARDAGLPKSVAPATNARAEFTRDLPGGRAVRSFDVSHQLQPPGGGQNSVGNLSCGTDPGRGEAYHFGPQTGRPCLAYTRMPQERVMVRQGTRVRNQPAPQTAPEPSPHERRLIVGYQREREARLAPTEIAHGLGTSIPLRVCLRTSDTSQDDISRVAAVSQAIGHGCPACSGMLTPMRTRRLKRMRSSPMLKADRRRITCVRFGRRRNPSRLGNPSRSGTDSQL